MMSLHRLVSSIVLLLVALVVVQRLDVVPCADEATAFTQDKDGAHAPISQDEGSGHDCLCHVSFVRTDVPPTLAVRTVRSADLVAADTPEPPDAHEAPAAPVPLG